MAIKIDFRLIDATMELNAPEEYLQLLEAHIRRSRARAQSVLDASTFDDIVDWQLAQQDVEWRTEFVLSRVLRNQYLVTLFAVYEAIVTEVANRLQHKRRIRVSLDDIRGRLLDRAKKYYEGVLQFDLSISNSHWERLTVLSQLRNIIAHSNGRIDMSPTKAATALEISGVDELYGFIIVSELFLKETFKLVKADLEDLITRYKEWDTNRMNQAPL